VPSDLDDPAPTGLSEALHAEHARMRATRREEGDADLAALAWARAAMPAQAAALHSGLLMQRSQGQPGGHHGTLAWIRCPQPGSVDAEWAAGLLNNVQAARAPLRCAAGNAAAAGPTAAEPALDQRLTSTPFSTRTSDPLRICGSSA